MRPGKKSRPFDLQLRKFSELQLVLFPRNAQAYHDLKEPKALPDGRLYDNVVTKSIHKEKQK